MKMSSILDRTRDWFTCPRCSKTNYCDPVKPNQQLKCKECGLELEKSPDGSVKPGGEAATGQSANFTGSDHSSQWVDTEESEAAEP